MKQRRAWKISQLLWEKTKAIFDIMKIVYEADQIYMRFCKCERIISFWS